MIRSSGYKQAPVPTYASLVAEHSALADQFCSAAGGPVAQLSFILTKMVYIRNLLNSNKVEA